MVVLLDSGCFFGETCATAVAGHVRVVLKHHRSGETTPLHGHAQPYLALVARGAFRQHGRALDTLCTPGSLAINTTGEEHSDRFEAEVSEVINIELPQSWIEALRGEHARDPGYAWTTRSGLLQRARLLRRHLESPEPLSRFVVEGMAAELLGLAAGAARREVRGSRPPAWVQVLEAALRESFRDPPSLAALAALANRSPSQVARGFRRWRGGSLGAFARRLRAEHARTALLHGQASLTEIALESGYADQSHMTRDLGAHLGCTPGRLRRSRAR